MKECGLCRHSRLDDNLWCQEPQCPVEDAPGRLRAGDRAGEVEIVQWITTLPAATLYKARRGAEVVLLKVAHPGYEDKLKREALFLAGHAHPVLPRLLPALSLAAPAEHPYGRTAARGRIVYFAVFEYVEGQVLREFLDRDPQPWYLTTGWLIAGLADALAFLNDRSLLHLCLSPEVVLVRFDQENVPRPILTDLGPVSYTHLDVYKRQGRPLAPGASTLTWTAPTRWAAWAGARSRCWPSCRSGRRWPAPSAKTCSTT